MEHLLITWGYLALLVATFISAMGLPIGSEIAIAYGGVLASSSFVAGAHNSHLNLVLVITVAVLGEILGSLVGYAIGYVGGRPLVDRLGRYVLLTRRDLDRAEAWFARRGEPVVLIGRLIPLLRSFVSLSAGFAKMSLAKFLAFTVIGCAIWCGALSGIGYSLGASWNRVIKGFSDAGYIAAVLFVLLICAAIFHRVRALRRESASVRN